MSYYTEQDVLDYIRENDVRFVRLAFCDIFGQIKNISITASDLRSVFDNGMGVDVSAIRGFMNVKDSDLYLYPDPTTLAILPWRPSEHGSVTRLYSGIYYPDKTPFEGDVRLLLKKTEKELESKGLSFQIGTESEFYLFKTDENGTPTLTPMDNASYLDVAPNDRGENIRRSISIYLEEMGISILSSHHEKGPGQNEITFKPLGPTEAADTLITFKSMVKLLAFRSGLFASFLPKPLFDESGSGLHISISANTEKKSFEYLEENISAGILKHIKEMQLFLNPVVNSYERLGSDGAPDEITYGSSNRDLLMRVPLKEGGKKNRVELRLADSASNPYLAIHLLLKAAEEGIERDLRIKDIELGKRLSSSLREAISEAESSEFINSSIPKSLLKCFIEAKLTDSDKAEKSEDKKAFAREMELLVT